MSLSQSANGAEMEERRGRGVNLVWSKATRREGGGQGQNFLKCVWGLHMFCFQFPYF